MERWCRTLDWIRIPSSENIYAQWRRLEECTQERRLVGSRRGRKRALVQSARHCTIHQFLVRRRESRPALWIRRRLAREPHQEALAMLVAVESLQLPRFPRFPELERHIDIALNVGLISVREGCRFQLIDRLVRLIANRLSLFRRIIVFS